MNPLELRKIIQIGYRFDQPEAAPILDANGLPSVPVSTKYWATFAFWIPAPKPYKRGPGPTRVTGAAAFELQALRDGAIFEHVQEFEFPHQPTLDKLREGLMKIWEALTAQSLGHTVNGVPVDAGAQMILVLSDMTAPSEARSV